MQAIKHLYKIGYGPSSSHTIAPYRFVKAYLDQFGACDLYEVTLGGSLALTADGHGTMGIIYRTLGTRNVVFKREYHVKENIMEITGYAGGIAKPTWHGVSLGGGSIKIDDFHTGDEDEVYAENNFEQIKAYLKNNECGLLEYVYSHEPDLKQHLLKCLDVMFKTVDEGLQREGMLNEDLKYYRIASKLYKKAKQEKDYLVAYSYAACEQNASGALMVTAPTLGACGILTSLMYYLHFNKKEPVEKLCDMLTIAGVFGNCIKQNASIAGSTGGCQAEVGTSCSMAAAALAYYNGCDLQTIEYAAEMGIEHFLGLTCDPVLGYVIVPCIERNAISILKAYECAYLAQQLDDIKGNLISFDSVVHAMNYTGNKLAIELKETSLGGLSLEYHK